MEARRPMTTIALLIAALVVLLLAGLLLVDRWRPAAPPGPADPSPRTGATARTPPAPPPVPGPESAESTAPPPSTPAPSGPVPESGPVRFGRIRFRDAVTGEILTSFEGARTNYRVAYVGVPTMEMNDMGVQEVPGEKGWIRTLPPGPIEHLDAARSAWEFSMPGYEVFRMVPGEDRDGQTVDLAPWQARVRGRITAAGEDARPLRSLILSGTEDEGTGCSRPRGLPATTGPFEIMDLPDGKWVLWAWTTDAAPRLHAVRRFERSGNVVDLGDLPLEPGASLRARVVDGDGRTVDKPRLAGFPGHRSIVSADVFLPPVPGVVPVPSEEDGGWSLFEELPVDMPWIVRSLSLPGVETRTRTPARAGAVATAEIPWTGRRVRCRIRFTVEGHRDFLWGPQLVLDSGPVEGWDQAGTLEAVLASGDHAVTHFVRVAAPGSPLSPFTGGGGREVIVRGRFTVPREEFHEADVVLSVPELPGTPR